MLNTFLKMIDEVPLTRVQLPYFLTTSRIFLTFEISFPHNKWKRNLFSPFAFFFYFQIQQVFLSFLMISTFRNPFELAFVFAIYSCNFVLTCYSIDYSHFSCHVPCFSLSFHILHFSTGWRANEYVII